MKKKLIFLNEEEMNDYYNEKLNSYQFWGNDGMACDVVIKFDLDTNASILCHNLDCIDIKAESINANNIEACAVTANDIYCQDIAATSIKADRIIIINYGSIDCMGSIQCSYIKCERLSNW